ncbi:hypothetical protein SAMN05421771_1013 [Granulicella pectinivorans]|jgi:hypothetical protein|uniref:Uncharacterized protein n=1 Tax=Granulicella pectinivorans TaxID=474950 RepID=A0A1I6LN90_9BACT|nr:hypothetical protein [Granulicella pectinivorans]SFS04987.1 hypothetical protein SAMN05421771_1013 [Granulicella pectinivorans]
MAIIQWITRVFIDVFGITHPTPEQERTATRFIGALLGIIAAGMILIVFLIYKLSHRAF